MRTGRSRGLIRHFDSRSRSSQLVSQLVLRFTDRDSDFLSAATLCRLWPICSSTPSLRLDPHFARLDPPSVRSDPPFARFGSRRALHTTNLPSSNSTRGSHREGFFFFFPPGGCPWAGVPGGGVPRGGVPGGGLPSYVPRVAAMSKDSAGTYCWHTNQSAPPGLSLRAAPGLKGSGFGVMGGVLGGGGLGGGVRGRC